MQQLLSRLALGLAACALAAAVSGCGSPGGGAFPRLGGTSTNIKQDVLSSEEKSEAIRDLSFQQSTHRESAKRQIEGQ